MPAEPLPPVGLGTMGIDDPGVVETAAEIGYRHFDTAQIYDNEAIVGQGLADAGLPRDEAFVATKVWADSLAHDDVIATTEASLDRLGLDAVDLLYVHRPIEAYDPADTLPAFDELVDRGLVRHVGVSNFSVPELETARDHLDAPLFAHQAECHPLFYTPDLVEFAREHDHYFVAYSPLVGGRADEVLLLRELAGKYDLTPAGVSLAWLCGKENVVPIPKASSQKHLEANLAAAAVDLDPADAARIDAIERREELFPE